MYITTWFSWGVLKVSKLEINLFFVRLVGVASLVGLLYYLLLR